MAVQRRFTKTAIRPESDTDKGRKKPQIYVFSIYFNIIMVFISLPLLTMEKFIYISVGSVPMVLTFAYICCISVKESFK